jgi:hypothetical protein
MSFNNIFTSFNPIEDFSNFGSVTSTELDYFNRLINNNSMFAKDGRNKLEILILLASSV